MDNGFKPEARGSASALIARDSAVVLDAPITPPMSPGRSEPEEDSIVVDAEPRYSGPELRPPLCLDHAMDVDTQLVAESAEQQSPSQRPARLLEDEKVHLQKSGLKLTDFEVRGTLGRSFCGSHCLLISDRNWNIRSCATCAPSKRLSFLWITELLRIEGSS